ncbi:helix-turn-helix transcriptional regulator [Rhodococcus sp. NPDC057135]|uniref:helix-turn-helix transcriptional regulator n=1 Tax=Rhodococcus sp. NPDC057135 TaxID=3346028 RepID=UPI0036310193
MSEPHQDSDRSEKSSHPPVLVFSFESAGNLYSILEHHLPNLLTSETSEVNSVSRALQSLAREHDNWADGRGFPSTAVRLLESIVCLMLAEWSAGWNVGNLSHDPRQSISAVLREVYSNPGKKWTLPAMSAIAGMSRSMFVSEFKSSVGEPPMQHLRRWRLALVADSLIVDPTLTLDRLAKKTGYSDAFNLSTAFKTHYGVSPSQYPSRVRTE